VEWARKNRSSALHRQFQWDVRKAAYEHWLSQARQLIAVHVVSEAGHRQTINLVIERPTGGYRPLDQVLNTATLREAAVNQAFGELERWADRHRHLSQEFGHVFAAINQAASMFYRDRDAAA
jgi:hypothetical protein